MRLNNSAQATTELAIFGSLIIICLAVLISYGQSLQEQQILQQQAFRAALKKAYDENAFASYNIIKNPRTANLFGGYGEGGRSSTSAGASVAWCLGTPEEKSYYTINEDEFELPDGTKIKDVETSTSTGYTSQETRYEDPTARVSTKQARLTDTITTYLRTETGTDIVVTQGLDSDGRYRQSAVGTEVSRQKTWTTPQ
ncbi:MAG: hypothetical protein PHJ00_01510 [Candidatus Omnitrophica bacterium]|jgi:type II secretory pathway pseudopilin PulG|nr:hypothetical protein [Candidatus Omnitrophota bacterium]MDD5654777.1 hypothetical protein [Candidatus Omnitrophota bacterium]